MVVRTKGSGEVYFWLLPLHFGQMGTLRRHGTDARRWCRRSGAVLLDDVHGGLLGARRRTVDADVLGDQVLLLVRTEPLILGDQSARPSGADLTTHVLRRLRGRLVGVGLRLLLGQPLVESLPD